MAAFDGIGRQRERRAGKADERHPAAERPGDLPDRIEHGRTTLPEARIA
jgi:hypothetical protein